MPSYYAVVHHEDGTAFGISFPDLRGCFSAADTEDEIISQAQDALALYMEDMGELPGPSSITELRRNPDIKQDLASGAFLIAVPVVPISQKARFNIVIETSLVETIDKVARATGLSRSEFIARAASKSLEETSGVIIETFRARNSSHASKTAAASALTPSKSKETTSAKAASAAAKVMKDPKASKEAKTAAASALTQKTAKKK